jgi:hypothetical protein
LSVGFVTAYFSWHGHRLRKREKITGMYRIKTTNISSKNVDRIFKDVCALLQEANHSVCHKRMGLMRGDP